MLDRPTRVLIVDDSEVDRATFRYFLEEQTRLQFDIQETSTASNGLEALAVYAPDCVLLDYRLPDADGLEVLRLIRERFETASFGVVFLTGSGDERLAVEALNSGAHDYLPKGLISPELLSRAIENVIEKVRLEREHQRMQQALEESERRFKTIVSTAPAAVYVRDIETRALIFVNEYSYALIGYSPEELRDMGTTFFSLLHPDDVHLLEQQYRSIATARDEEIFEVEYRLRHKDGSWRFVCSRSRVFDRNPDGRVRSMVAAVTDVTTSRRIEAELRSNQLRIELAEQAAKIGFWDWKLVEEAAYCSPAYFALYGLEGDRRTQPFEEWLNCVHPEDRAAARADVASALIGELYDKEFRIIRPDGSVRWLGARGTVIRENGHATRIVGANIDITDLKTAQEELRLAHDKLQTLMDVVPAAILTALDAQASRIEGNRMAYQLLELPLGTNASLTAQGGEKPANYRVVKEGAEVETESLPIQKVARTGQSILNSECELLFSDGRTRHILGNVLPLLDPAGQPNGAVAAYLDVTERKRIEKELLRSNQDLEDFASIAGHDLQEPLRSISGFADLLHRRANLSSDTQPYLEYIRTGASRMKELIEDLLAYARTAAESRGLLRVISWNDAVQDALLELKQSIEESDAGIVCEPLPNLPGNTRLVRQLFQNLIGNAIKYRSEQRPEIHISAERRVSDWLFRVGDNGLGLEMEYAEMIFEPFKRLHGREHYSGTGIGLAICKRVVEHHGGRIWVESQPGHGSNFFFSLPEASPNAEYGSDQNVAAAG